MPCPHALPVALLTLSVTLLLGWWLWRLSVGGARLSLPLRQVVDATSIRGVERRWRATTPDAGRRLLRRLASTPAVLVSTSTGWYVWSGRHLRVSPVLEEDPNAVVVEFTFQGRPRVIRDVDDTMYPEAYQRPAGVPREIPGGNALDMRHVREPTRIQAFHSLTEAVAAARVTPSETATATDLIVGGAPAHPMYYVVPVDVGAAHTTYRVAVVSRPDGPPQRVWVVVPDNTSHTQATAEQLSKSKDA